MTPPPAFDVEIIVVDSNSTGNTPLVIAEATRDSSVVCLFRRDSNKADL
jgi:glycosyltransferase involved in cell wall biosynthesis